MPRHYKVFGFLLVTILGVYGCAKAPGSSTPTEGNATATAKAQKLEEDYRAAVAARDQFRQKLVAAEQQQANTQRELEQARNEAKARTGERDAVNAQYEAFRKNLKELIGNADASLGALKLPAPKPSSEQSVRK